MSYFCVKKCFAKIILHCGFSVFASTCCALDITVIASDDKPVNIAGYQENIHYLNLDAISAIEKQLAKDLPINEQEALAIVENRISDIGQERLNARITAAYQAIIIALRYGVDRYPAIIFDNRFLVYGVADLETAIKHYQLHQNKGVIDE